MVPRVLSATPGISQLTLQIQQLSCWGRSEQQTLQRIQFWPVFAVVIYVLIYLGMLNTLKTQDYKLVFFLCFCIYFSSNKACEFKGFCCNFSNLLGSNLDELFD